MDVPCVIETPKANGLSFVFVTTRFVVTVVVLSSAQPTASWIIRTLIFSMRRCVACC